MFEFATRRPRASHGIIFSRSKLGACFNVRQCCSKPLLSRRGALKATCSRAAAYPRPARAALPARSPPAHHACLARL